MQLPQTFVHHVYFWLNNPLNNEDHAALLQGLQQLSKVPTIQQFHIGVPAQTNRAVIENSYQFSWLALFNNDEDEAVYQHHPIHLKFIEDCKHLWSKVIVYDAVSAV